MLAETGERYLGRGWGGAGTRKTYTRDNGGWPSCWGKVQCGDGEAFSTRSPGPHRHWHNAWETEGGLEILFQTLINWRDPGLVIGTMQSLLWKDRHYHLEERYY